MMMTGEGIISERRKERTTSQAALEVPQLHVGSLQTFRHSKQVGKGVAARGIGVARPVFDPGGS